MTLLIENPGDIHVAVTAVPGRPVTPGYFRVVIESANESVTFRSTDLNALRAVFGRLHRTLEDFSKL